MKIHENFSGILSDFLEKPFDIDQLFVLPRKLFDIREEYALLCQYSYFWTAASPVNNPRPLFIEVRDFCKQTHQHHDVYPLDVERLDACANRLRQRYSENECVCRVLDAQDALNLLDLSPYLESSLIPSKREGKAIPNLSFNPIYCLKWTQRHYQKGRSLEKQRLMQQECFSKINEGINLYTNHQRLMNDAIKTKLTARCADEWLSEVSKGLANLDEVGAEEFIAIDCEASFDIWDAN